MKTRTLTFITAVTLFGVLSIPVRLAAQEQKEGMSTHHRYKLVDIGTFGGPESNVNPAVSAGPIVSRRGTAVGGSATSVPTSPHSHPFVCGGLDGSVPFVFHAFKWQDGVVSDLGALPPEANNCSEAQGVNERGEIVLQSENSVIDPLTGINEVRAVRWKNGEIEELGTFGGNNSLANQINSRGQIAGAASKSISACRSHTGSGRRRRAPEAIGLTGCSDLALTKGSNALLTIINHSIKVDWFLRLLLDHNFGWRDN